MANLSKDYKSAVANKKGDHFLRKVGRTKSEVIRRSSSIDMKRAQNYLSYIGIYKGLIHGDLDKQSSSALRRYQQANNLKPTGALDQGTRIFMYDSIPSTEFEYYLAKRKDSIQGYNIFLKNNKTSKNYTTALKRKTQLKQIASAKQVKKARAIAVQTSKLAKEREQRRKARLASLRNEIRRENAREEIYKGRAVYMCRKVSGLQRIIEWGLGEKWETCKVTVSDVSRNRVNVHSRYSCGIGWNADENRWVDKSQIFFRPNCDKWMPAIQ